MQTAQLESHDDSNSKTTHPRRLCRLAFEMAGELILPTSVLQAVEAARDIDDHVAIQWL